MTNVRDTSLAAYWELQTGKAVSGQQAAVLENLAVYGGSTRKYLAQSLGWGINVVCGRVNELLKLGLVTDDLLVVDEESGRKVHSVQLVQVQ